MAQDDSEIGGLGVAFLVSKGKWRGSGSRSLDVFSANIHLILRVTH